MLMYVLVSPLGGPHSIRGAGAMAAGREWACRGGAPVPEPRNNIANIIIINRNGAANANNALASRGSKLRFRLNAPTTTTPHSG